MTTILQWKNLKLQHIKRVGAGRKLLYNKALMRAPVLIVLCMCAVPLSGCGLIPDGHEYWEGLDYSGQKADKKAAPADGTQEEKKKEGN